MVIYTETCQAHTLAGLFHVSLTEPFPGREEMVSEQCNR